MRAALRIGVILLGALCPAMADRHVGPVTGLAGDGERVFSVSQAGIGLGRGEGLILVHEATTRLFDVACVPVEHGVSLLAVGGEPGRKAFLATYKAPPGAPSLEQGRQEELPGGDLLYRVAVSPKGNLVAVASADGTVWCRSLPLSNDDEWKPCHRHTAPARAVEFSPDGRWLASGGLDGVVMLSPADQPGRTEPRKLLDHTAGVECLAFSPDSRSLASGSRDSRVRLHTVDGKLVRTYQGLGMDDEPVAGRVVARVLALAWGEHLVAGTSKGSLHRLAKSDEHSAQLTTRFREPVYALLFDAAGRLVAGTRVVSAVSLEE